MPKANGLQFTARVGELPSDVFSVVGFELVIQPPVWRLGLMQNSRIFQTQTTDTITHTPVVVPWEEIQAWVIQAQGATQYGVQRQYGFGFGGEDPNTEKSTSLEIMSGGLPLAISTWEALRAYMEYEVNSLEDIQVSQELQKPGDPPWEGVHTFYNARERMRRRRQNGEVGRAYPFFWYCYHLLSLWTLPNHLTEWEVRKVQRLNRRATPESMQQWSEPLPQDQWAKPRSVNRSALTRQENDGSHKSSITHGFKISSRKKL